MIRAIGSLALSLALLASAAATADDPHASCPMHARADGSAEHGRHVDGRHDTLGMSHTKSAHSFRLFADGGAIELRAKDPADDATVAAIRAHLQDISPQFAKGDFSTPRFVHGYPPDGVAQLGRLRNDITYRYQQAGGGGRIRITTKSAEALAAIHAFLRFQVTEHRTADSGKVEVDDRRQENH